MIMMMSIPLYSSMVGNNSLLISQVAKFYLRPGFKIADVTYGKGVFWKKVDLSAYDFHPSDILTCKNAAYDFCDLPYEDNSLDVVVFDPPYVHNPGQMIVDANYRNRETTRGMYHDDILDLYKKGMCEAWRVIRPGGFLWVKCKDELESSAQRWSHIEIFLMAIQMGFYAKDLFILTQLQNPIIQFKDQQHGRKNHSYLWIFEKIVLTKGNKCSLAKKLSMQKRRLSYKVE